MSQATRLSFSVGRREDILSDSAREDILANPGFGASFTDHMVTATWTAGQGWHDAKVEAYAPIQLDPSASVLHYAQEIFEGMKAYRHEDGSIWTFRPQVNAARFIRSARRLALPELPEEDFIESLRALVDTDRAWVPSGATGEASLYLRPFMIATEPFLGVRPAKEVRYVVIASPAGPYFSGGISPVSIWLSEDYIRAAPGGTGAAKCGGNYAASLAPQVEASEKGCDQVVFLDGAERRWIEELGGMNLFFVHKDGSIVTPELTGTILEGVTRQSIIQLARDRGHEVTERRVSIDEWREGAQSGDLTEVFACGTAAVITPVGRLVWSDGEVRTGNQAGSADADSVALTLRRALLDIQYGRAQDTHGWLHRLA